jgi:hypothetical protein
MGDIEFLLHQDDSIAYNVKSPSGAILYYRSQQEALDMAKDLAETWSEEQAPAVYEVRRNAPVRKIK